jgi:hypothetical protein
VFYPTKERCLPSYIMATPGVLTQGSGRARQELRGCAKSNIRPAS